MQNKSRFRSRSEHSLDGKGRLNFPSRFKDVLRQYESEVLMVTAWGKHLRVFPVTEWEELESKLFAQGKEQPGLVRFVRQVVSGITECALDKQGRILLPLSIRTESNLKKEVVVTGMVDWVEIWDRDAWIAEHKATQDNFETFEEKLAELGVF